MSRGSKKVEKVYLKYNSGNFQICNKEKDLEIWVIKNSKTNKFHTLKTSQEIIQLMYP